MDPGVQTHKNKATPIGYLCSKNENFFIHVMSLKEAFGKFFFPFQEVFERCIEYMYREKFLVHFRETVKFS